MADSQTSDSEFSELEPELSAAPIEDDSAEDGSKGGGSGSESSGSAGSSAGGSGSVGATPITVYWITSLTGFAPVTDGSNLDPDQVRASREPQPDSPDLAAERTQAEASLGARLGRRARIVDFELDPDGLPSRGLPPLYETRTVFGGRRGGSSPEAMRRRRVSSDGRPGILRRFEAGLANRPLSGDSDTDDRIRRASGFLPDTSDQARSEFRAGFLNRRQVVLLVPKEVADEVQEALPEATVAEFDPELAEGRAPEDLAIDAIALLQQDMEYQQEQLLQSRLEMEARLRRLWDEQFYLASQQNRDAGQQLELERLRAQIAELANLVQDCRILSDDLAAGGNRADWASRRVDDTTDDASRVVRGADIDLRDGWGNSAPPEDLIAEIQDLELPTGFSIEMDDDGRLELSEYVLDATAIQIDPDQDRIEQVDVSSPEGPDASVAPGTIDGSVEPVTLSEGVSPSEDVPESGLAGLGQTGVDAGLELFDQGLSGAEPAGADPVAITAEGAPVSPADGASVEPDFEPAPLDGAPGIDASSDEVPEAELDSEPSADQPVSAGELSRAESLEALGVIGSDVPASPAEFADEGSLAPIDSPESVGRSALTRELQAGQPQDGGAGGGGTGQNRTGAAEGSAIPVRRNARGEFYQPGERVSDERGDDGGDAGGSGNQHDSIGEATASTAATLSNAMAAHRRVSGATQGGSAQPASPLAAATEAPTADAALAPAPSMGGPLAAGPLPTPAASISQQTSVPPAPAQPMPPPSGTASPAAPWPTAAPDAIASVADEPSAPIVAAEPATGTELPTSSATADGVETVDSSPASAAMPGPDANVPASAVSEAETPGEALEFPAEASSEPGDHAADPAQPAEVGQEAPSSADAVSPGDQPKPVAHDDVDQPEPPAEPAQAQEHSEETAKDPESEVEPELNNQQQPHGEASPHAELEDEVTPDPASGAAMEAETFEDAPGTPPRNVALRARRSSARNATDRSGSPACNGSGRPRNKPF